MSLIKKVELLLFLQDKVKYFIMGKFKLGKKDLEIIKKANIQKKISQIVHFSGEDSKNYAIIVNKITDLYAIRLINYNESDEGIKINAVKRFPDLMGFYRTKVEANDDIERIKNSQELLSQCVYEIEIQEDKAENVLLVGRTVSGKSTLANVISKTNKFTESSDSVSHTKNFQSENFE